MTEIVVRTAELANPAEAAAVLAILDLYARELSTDGTGLADEVRRRLSNDLQQIAHGRYYVAVGDQQVVGAAVCFLGYSTFRGRPLLNIHDLAVLPAYRSRGIGRQLLEFAERQARAEGCCKLTLEVLVRNVRARALYERLGYNAGPPDDRATLFCTKELAECAAADTRRGLE